MSSPTSGAAFDDELSGTSSSSSSHPSWLSHQSLSQNSQNQNPLHELINQILEDAFSRLSVSPFSLNLPPFDVVRDGLIGINGPTKTVPFDRREFHLHHHHQSNNLVQQAQQTNTGFKKLSWNNNIISNAANIGISESQNSRGSSNSSWGGEFLSFEPLLRQNGYVRGLSGVPLSSGGVGELQRNSSVVVLNELFSGNGWSVPGLNGNGGIPFWLSELRGRVVLLAKDQHGSRILKQKMEALTPQEVSFFLLEMINDVVDLMVDPFGTHVVQKMLEICTDQQRTLIILMIIKNNLQFVKICISQNGIRAIEKLLERVTTQEQQAFIVAGLMPGTVALAKDMNGHRVILYCLKHFSQDDTKYLLNAVANNCFGIAADKTGCCLLQECVKYAQGEIKLKLIAEIIVNALFLAEDCYGNYVVQHLLSLTIPGVTESLLRRLEGTFFHLASNKYGSNVVEKFFQFSGELHSASIILELLHDPNVAMLLVHPYGNYVMQTALVVSKGFIRNALAQLIQQNSPMMRSNIYGKKVLQRFDRVRLRHT